MRPGYNSWWWHRGTGQGEYLTDKLRLPVRMCSPWTNLDFGKLQPPDELKTMYITAGVGAT